LLVLNLTHILLGNDGDSVANLNLGLLDLDQELQLILGDIFIR
jgi:hypothetical protein